MQGGMQFGVLVDAVLRAGSWNTILLFGDKPCATLDLTSSSIS